MIGGVVLIKLAKLCYEGKDMTKFIDCILMSKGLFTAPCLLGLPTPKIDVRWNNQTLRDLKVGGGAVPVASLFADKQILQPSEMLHSLQVLTQTLIDMDKSRLAFPVVSIMEYVA